MASRTPSATTLSITMASASSTPGAIETQGRVYSCACPSVIIVPQLAFGACTPIDRNDRDDSVSMSVAISSGRNTITVGRMFGSSSPSRMRVVDAPWPTALSTNSRRRRASTSPRTGRAR